MMSDRENRLISDDSAGDEPQPVARPDLKPTATRNPRRVNGRTVYPGRRQVTAHIPQQLFLWLKSISAQTDIPMVEIFEVALTDYVNSYAAKKKFR